MSSLVEGPTPLYASVLYKLQAAYYSLSSSAAFDSGDVPSYITTNPFVAHSFATAILHTWRDLRDAGTVIASKPLYVLELGAGSGRLGALLLRELLDRAASARIDPALIRYVMSDFSEAMIGDWEANPVLEELVARGALQFAAFDVAKPFATGPVGIHMRGSGKTLTPSHFENPLLVIGNYLFDSLPMDVLRVQYPRDGRTHSMREPHVLLRGHVSVSSLLQEHAKPAENSVDANNLNPAILSRMKTEWSYLPINTRSVGTDCIGGYEAAGSAVPYPSPAFGSPEACAHLNEVVDWYVDNCRQLRNVEDGYRSGLLVNDAASDSAGSNSEDDASSDAADDKSRGSDDWGDASEAEGSEHRGGSGIDSYNTPDADAHQSTFTLPLGAFQCLETLRRLCGDAGYVMLCIDKGISSPSTFAGASHPDVHVHGKKPLRSSSRSSTRKSRAETEGRDAIDSASDSAVCAIEGDRGGPFSMMVNFHALQLWAASYGGQAIVSPDDDVNVKTAVVVMVPRRILTGGNDYGDASSAVEDAAPSSRPKRAMLVPSLDLPLLTDTFTHSLQRFGPSEWFDLQRGCIAARRKGFAAMDAVVSRRMKQREGRQRQRQRRRSLDKGGETEEAGAGAGSKASSPPRGKVNVYDDEDALSLISSSFINSDTDDDNASDGSYGDNDDEAGVEGGEANHDDDADANKPGPAFAAALRRTRAPQPSALPLQTDPPLITSSHPLTDPPLTSVRSIVALLRLSHWDPDVFVVYRDLLGRRLPFLTPPRRKQLLDGLGLMLQRFFPPPQQQHVPSSRSAAPDQFASSNITGGVSFAAPIRYPLPSASSGDVDVPFHVGRMLQTAGEHAAALRMYRRSLELVGPHPATAFCISTCSAALGNSVHARFWMGKAVEWAPEGRHDAAQQWLQQNT